MTSAVESAPATSAGADDAWLTGVLREGDLLVAAQGAGEPTPLLESVMRFGDVLRTAELFVGLSHSRALFERVPSPIPLVSFGAMGPLASVAAAGALSVIPCHFADVPRQLDVRAPGRLVLLVQVSPSDVDGFHSFGVAVDYTYELLSRARAVIAEVNDQMPMTSAPRVHGSAFAATVRTSRPLPIVATARTGAVHDRIAENVARLVEDESTIQLGLGALPSVVGRAISTRRGLRVRSTLVGDWLLELAQAGALSDEPGAVVISEGAGSAELYRYMVNADVAICPVGELTRPELLAGIDRFVAMNSALEVDLTGQVNAEQLVSGYVGGIGGQPDFLRAAQRSAGGKSVIMLPATAAGGQQSRIVRRLHHNAVTTARSGVDFIVTEYGVADLRGKGLAERAHAMSLIAAPKHRAALRDQADVADLAEQA